MLGEGGRRGSKEGQSKEEGMKGEWEKLNLLKLFSLEKVKA